MNLSKVLALFTLIVIVKGNLIAAMARPVILSLGTVFTAMTYKGPKQPIWQPYDKEFAPEGFEWDNSPERFKRDEEKLKKIKEDQMKEREIRAKRFRE